MHSFYAPENSITKLEYIWWITCSWLMTDVRYLSSLQHMPNIYNYSMSQKKVVSPILSLLTQVFSGHPVELLLQDFSSISIIFWSVWYFILAHSLGFLSVHYQTEKRMTENYKGAFVLLTLLFIVNYPQFMRYCWIVNLDRWSSFG